MNVYDFDNTIYAGDSTLDFYIYCLKKYPSVLLCVPIQLYGFLAYKTGKIDKTIFKSKFFTFVRKVPDIENVVEEFWNEHLPKIKGWYVKQKKTDDLIISASPYFLLKNVCCRIGIKHLIASEVDPLTGFFQSKNCYGEAKVERFFEQFPTSKIDQFYSDSFSDEPMAQIADNAFIVNGDKISAWSGEKLKKQG